MYPAMGRLPKTILSREEADLSLYYRHSYVKLLPVMTRRGFLYLTTSWLIIAPALCGFHLKELTFAAWYYTVISVASMFLFRKATCCSVVPLVKKYQ